MMIPRPYLLALLLLLMPIVAIIDGLAVAPLAVVLFVLLAWVHRKALADWRAIYASCSQGFVILLLLAVWPVLTNIWSILPHLSLVTSLRSAALLLMAPLGLFLSQRQGDFDRRVWLLPALGVALAALPITSAQLPHEGLIGLGADIFKYNELDYLVRSVNRGLCALVVLVWPATIGLRCNGYRKLAALFPWVLLPAVFFLHSLSAKTGLIAGMITFYGMILWPAGVRRIIICAVPLAFVAWPVLFHHFEPVLRGAMWGDLPPSSRHRVEIWHFAIQKWQERPWLGWGVDSSRAIPGGLEEISPGLVKLPLHPHNLALNVLLEEGLVGFGLFAFALVLFVRRALPAGQERSPMIAGARAAAIVSYITIGMSGFGMWQSWWEATAVTAFLIAVFAESKNKTPASL